ncbi:MAG: hypothetical protein CEN91_269 [Candidatus Berkelbacteria bacterium Licking1014_85]|uniref:Uncharacterized protein n=1 Tax=Candidatus Berkelbacteria bacterium Licking1014_85 TaxID=2017148 RepID=A0A554LK92_9BACT|nr:MAG: hypothetical protein CEN91_269 [Candidatus Berkelbacteria bacterium Licking1014_85]
MFTATLKDKQLKYIILGLTLMLTIVFLTIELKVIYNIYSGYSDSSQTSVNLIDEKGFKKILEKINNP